MTPLQALHRTINLRLTREQEYALIRAAKKGDAKARDRLFTCYMSFIMRMVYSYHRRGTPWAVCEELIGEGSIALHYALRKFEIKRGFRFSTYALFWVRAFLNRYLKLEVRQCADVSLDEEIPGCVDETRLDRVPSEEDGPEDHALQSADIRHVRVIVQQLGAENGIRGREIIERRILDRTETLESLGARYGISREGVRQTEVKLKKSLVARLKRSAA
jgi:RNA polymerase primary sigma factor